MKYSNSFLIIGFVVFFASCSKTYTCTCSEATSVKTPSVAAVSTGTSTVVYSMEKLTKGQAKINCWSGTSTVKSDTTSFITDRTCTLN